MHTLRTRALARRSLSSFSLRRFHPLQRSLSATTPIADSDHAVQNKVLVEAKACARAAILNRPVALNALTTNMVAILDGITMGGGVGVSIPWTFRVATDKTLRNARHFSTDAGSSFSCNVGRSFLFRGHKQLRCMLPCSVRMLSSNSSTPSSQQAPKEGTRKDISTVEDPFDAPTYHIPEKPVTFTEGASYSVVILAGLGIAGLAAYAVFKELIFQPKEYKVFGKALERIQRDSQVTVRIGSPVTGYGSESRNRAARQRIPNRVWTDEDGVEHVEVNFYIRGPHGAGKVYTEMFKDNSDNKWKFTYLIVEIKSPTHAQLMLESYVPA